MYAYLTAAKWSFLAGARLTVSPAAPQGRLGGGPAAKCRQLRPRRRAADTRPWRPRGSSTTLPLEVKRKVRYRNSHHCAFRLPALRALRADGFRATGNRAAPRAQRCSGAASSRCFVIDGALVSDSHLDRTRQLKAPHFARALCIGDKHGVVTVGTVHAGSGDRATASRHGPGLARIASHDRIDRMIA